MAETDRGTIDMGLLDAIGAAIQEKLESEDAYTPGQMPAAIRSIETGITPTGTISITQNGTVDVTQYASANVNVSGGSGSDEPFALKNYIECSGTQYINTGYIPKANSVFEAVVNAYTNNAVYACLFGSRTNINNSDAIYFAIRSNGRVAWEAYWGKGTAIVRSQFSLLYDTKATYKNGRLSFGANNIVYEFGDVRTGTSFTPTAPIYLMNLNSNGSTDGDTALRGKYYRFRVYEDDAVVMNLLPALGTNNVPCMRDTVTGNYFYNAGTGDFVYGTDT